MREFASGDADTPGLKTQVESHCQPIMAGGPTLLARYWLDVDI